MAIRLVAQMKDEASAGLRGMKGAVENLKSPLETAAKNTKKWANSNKELNDRVGLVKSSVKALGAVAEAVGTAWKWLQKTSKGMRELAKEAGQAQIENQRLQFVTEASGLSWNAVSKEADKFIDRMMRMSRFSDEELKASLQMGIRLFHDYGVAERMTATAADFAASTGKGFIQAQQDIRRVLEGSTASIRRYDAHLADLMDTNLKLLPPTTALSRNLALMEERFKGAAQTELGNYIALLIQQKNAMLNLRQTIGSLLLPIFSVLVRNWTNFIFMMDEAVKKSEAFRRVTMVFTELADRLRGDGKTSELVIAALVRILNQLGGTVELVVRHIFVIVDVIKQMAGWGRKAGEEQSVFKDALSAIETVVTALAKALEWVLLGAIKAVGVILVTFTAHWETFKAALVLVKDTAVMAFEVIRHGALVAFVGILTAIPYVIDAFASVEESFTNLATKMFGGPLETIMQLLPGVSKEAAKGMRLLVEGWSKQESSIRPLAAGVRKFRDEVAGTVVDYEATNKKISEHKAAIDAAREAKQAELEVVKESIRTVIAQKAIPERRILEEAGKEVPDMLRVAGLLMVRKELTEQQNALLEKKKEIEESMPKYTEAADYAVRNEKIQKNNELLAKKTKLMEELRKIEQLTQYEMIPPEQVMGPFPEGARPTTEVEIRSRIAAGPISERAAEIAAEIAAIEALGLTYQVPLEIPEKAFREFKVSTDTNIIDSANRARAATLDWEDSVKRVANEYERATKRASEFVAAYVDKAEALVKTEIKSEVAVRVETEIKPVKITVDAKDFGDVLIVDRISKSVSDKIYNTLINDPNMKRMRESLDPEEFARHLSAVFNEMMEGRRRELESMWNQP